MSTKAYHKLWRAKNIERCRAYSRRWYQKNKEAVCRRTTANRNAKKKEYNETQRKREQTLRQATHWYKITKGCKDCGVHDIRILEFDHVPERGKKEINLGGTTLLGLPRVWKEVQKCDIVCSNCHSIRTRKRNGLDKCHEACYNGDRC